MSKMTNTSIASPSVAIESAAAAELLGVSKSHIEKLRLFDPVNSPPYFRVGRFVRYWPEHLRCWIDEQIVD
jgi:hypothetical protein